MQLNLKKALFLSYLLTVAGLSCEAAPGDLNATATPPPCNGISGAAECLIAYQQPELELVTGSNDNNVYMTLAQESPACGGGRDNRYNCLPPPNGKPHCDLHNRLYPHC
ncbi:hypothetical protein NL676_014780 [Syzygium grande]|nr:hypothetical protein NL676_014780 [Syzygium grande]